MSESIAQLISEAQDATAFFTKDSKVGDAITGTITAVSLRQVRDYITNKPNYWEDNTPQQQIVIVVDSDELATGEDDGLRAVYVKWWGVWRKAFAKAITASGATEPEIGGILTVTFESEVPNKDTKMDAMKVYSYAYTNPATGVTS